MEQPVREGKGFRVAEYVVQGVFRLSGGICKVKSVIEDEDLGPFRNQDLQKTAQVNNINVFFALLILPV